MAGFSVHLSGRFDAPSAFVWSALVDLAAVAEWLDAVEEIDAPASGHLRGRWRIGKRWVSGEIVGVETPRRVVVALRGLAGLVREMRVTVGIAPAERGTSFEVEVTGDAAVMASALRPWVRLRAEIALHRAVRDFRSWVEDRARDVRQRARRVQSPPPRPLPMDLAGVDLVGA